MSLHNVMYVLSGYDGRTCLTSVERYDDQAERWDYVASMNVGRSFPGNLFRQFLEIEIVTF